MWLSCLRALRSYLLTCLTCLCASRAYVSSCLKLLRAFVPSCLKLLRPYVPTCLYIFFMPTRLRALNYFCTCVRSFFTCLRAYNHAQNILSFTSIPCIAVFFLIIWPFIPFKTPKQTPAGKTAYPNPIL